MKICSLITIMESRMSSGRSILGQINLLECAVLTTWISGLSTKDLNTLLTKLHLGLQHHGQSILGIGDTSPTTTRMDQLGFLGQKPNTKLSSSKESQLTRMTDVLSVRSFFFLNAMFSCQCTSTPQNQPRRRSGSGRSPRRKLATFTSGQKLSASSSKEGILSGSTKALLSSRRPTLLQRLSSRKT